MDEGNWKIEKMAWGRYNNKDNCKDKYIFLIKSSWLFFQLKIGWLFALQGSLLYNALDKKNSFYIIQNNFLHFLWVFHMCTLKAHSMLKICNFRCNFLNCTLTFLRVFRPQFLNLRVIDNLGWINHFPWLEVGKLTCILWNC